MANVAQLDEVFLLNPNNKAFSAYCAAEVENAHEEVVLYNNLFWLVEIRKILLFDVDLHTRQIFVQRYDGSWTEGLNVSEANDLVQQLLGKHI